MAMARPVCAQAQGCAHECGVAGGAKGQQGSAGRIFFKTPCRRHKVGAPLTCKNLQLSKDLCQRQEFRQDLRIRELTRRSAKPVSCSASRFAWGLGVHNRCGPRAGPGFRRGMTAS